MSDTLNYLEHYEYDLIKFDDQFTQEHREQLLQLNTDKYTYFKAVYGGVKCTEFVGTIQVSDLRITVHPKTSRKGDTEQWRDVLLHLLKYTHDLPIHTLGSVESLSEQVDLIELYFSAFLTSLEQLIARGLVKRYRKKESNQPCLKGKLLFNQHLKHNLVHQERFYTAHTTYDAQHLIHQIFAETLEVVRLHSRSQAYKTRVKRTQERMPELSRIKITSALLDNIKLDRKTAHYAECFHLSRLILLNCSPGLREGDTRVFGMMFNMFELWEKYILRCLQSVRDQHIKSVRGQERLKFWQNRQLKPDIVIEYIDQTRLIIDTKWKILKNNSPAIEDLRQMYTYHHFGQAEKTLLLYPSEDTKDQEFNFKPFEDIFKNKASEVPYITNPKCAIGHISIFESDGKLRAPNVLGEAILKKSNLLI